MIEQPIRMEGFFPIFSLILIKLNFIVEQLKDDQQKSQIKKMSNLMDIYELSTFHRQVKKKEKSQDPLPHCQKITENTQE